MIKCCEHCTPETGRYPGCGSHCDKYLAEKAEQARLKAKNRGQSIFSIIPKRDKRIPQK